MNVRTSSDRNGTAWRLAALFCVVGLTLAGCGGDDGVNIANDQKADPVVLDFPIAYVRGPLPVDVNDPTQLVFPDSRELIRFDLGNDLWFRDRASPSTQDRNLTFIETQGIGDARDVEVSIDGTRFLFAMRGPADLNLDLDDPAQPTWNIWEYDITTDQLRRIIASDITAEAGHDIAPHYLPDGRIVFSSTRQRQSRAILLDEGKPQYAAVDEDRNEHAFMLHVMDDDGSNIMQTSFNQSHDMDPFVLASGEIVFTRWDNMGSNNAMHLYKMSPDGTNTQLVYGANSHDTGTNGSTIQFLSPKEMQDGRVMVIARPFNGTEFGGDLLAIEVPDYIENTQPKVSNIGILNGPAQTRAVINDVRTDTMISPGGRFSAAYPLWDSTDRMFVSWSQCRLEDPLTLVILACTATNLADPNLVAADPLYAIWLYDMSNNTQLPVVVPEEGFIYTDVAAAQPRTNPSVIFDNIGDPTLIAENAAILHIRSAYDIDGTDVATPDIATLADPAVTMADQRPARFLRVVKAVSLPDQDTLDFRNTAFGRSAQQGMREIVGYAPIEPDGSVKVKVPAEVPLAVSVLDVNGRRVTQRHQAWIQLRPGEERDCGGCHDGNSGLSHGSDEAFASVNPGAPVAGQPFPNTDPTIVPDQGESMAEARARNSCANDQCNALNMTMDVVFDDVWTDPVAAGRAPDAPFAYLYTDLSTPAPVNNTQCLTTWSALCRTVINYDDHMHPIWEVVRQIIDPADGVTVLADNTCTLCHNTLDAAGMAQIPAGQLDLTGGPSADEADHQTSYRELLFTDNEQELNNGALQDVLVQVGVDQNGNPIFATVPVAPSMSVAGANASGTFFSRFDTGGTHEGYLTPAELRLIAEWLDIGGQYYNNPFDAPLN